MSARAIMLTHAQVVIDPEVAMPDWGLSDLGAARHKRFAEALDCAGVKTVFAAMNAKPAMALRLLGMLCPAMADAGLPLKLTQAQHQPIGI